METKEIYRPIGNRLSHALFRTFVNLTSALGGVTYGILAFVLLVGAVVLISDYFPDLIGGITDVFVAVIGATATLIGVLFTFILQRNKELELADARHRNDLALDQRKMKQDHYRLILQELAPYIRDRSKKDDFTKAYLHTCIAGSEEVFERAYDFLDDPTKESLQHLVSAMRSDLDPSDKAKPRTERLFSEPRDDFL